MVTYYNGCLFDSQAELKYALSIEDHYAYLLHPKTVFNTYYKYHGKIIQIEEYTKSYKPDFLIRSYKENVAVFIEIKREGFNDEVNRRNGIMRKFLNSFPTPLDFKWVMWSDRMLSNAKEAKFRTIMANQHYERKFHRRLMDNYNRNTRSPYTFPNMWSDKEYRNFVIYGANPIV